MKLSGKVAIITGASRGIGRALAVELAKSGCGLVLTALETEQPESLSHELGRSGVSVTAMATNLADTASRTTLIDLGVKRSVLICLQPAQRFHGLP